MENYDSVFDGNSEQELDFDTIFDQEDDLVETVAGEAADLSPDEDYTEDNGPIAGSKESDSKPEGAAGSDVTKQVDDKDNGVNQGGDSTIKQAKCDESAWDFLNAPDTSAGDNVEIKENADPDTYLLDENYQNDSDPVLEGADPDTYLLDEEEQVSNDGKCEFGHDILDDTELPESEPDQGEHTDAKDIKDANEAFNILNSIIEGDDPDLEDDGEDDDDMIDDLEEACKEGCKKEGSDGDDDFQTDSDEELAAAEQEESARILEAIVNGDDEELEEDYSPVDWFSEEVGAETDDDDALIDLADKPDPNGSTSDLDYEPTGDDELIDLVLSDKE